MEAPWRLHNDCLDIGGMLTQDPGGGVPPKSTSLSPSGTSLCLRKPSQGDVLLQESCRKDAVFFFCAGNGTYDEETRNSNDSDVYTHTYIYIYTYYIRTF